MGDFRSKSCRMGGFYGGGKTAPTSIQDFRSYSANYTSNSNYNYNNSNKEIKMKKSKSTFGSSSSRSWSFSDPELQRKKRVASYKVYTVEGKLKGSFRKSLKWIKNTYSQVHSCETVFVLLGSEEVFA
ncbi:uncharacterized protein LOC123219621 [Mangifera indica]|uniref:uncharacterized protein LOC123219621 n=1 Tax=Mangifera indica TaxID=29780 RepID=UPI001CFAD693|nr:uncharacterized protein LOC123219621 [Mangifera indica]